MKTSLRTDASTLKKLSAISIMAFALAACGGGGGGDDTAGGGGGGTPPLGPGEEAGCFDECKKFMAALVDDFAAGIAPRAAKVEGEDALNIIVDGDKVTFAVASVALATPRPGDFGAAFPVSEGLDYKLIIDKGTGDITVDNNDGKTFTFNAYEEATYFQEIDYGKTELADVNKSHYAYLAFDPKTKANTLGKAANLRRQWKQTNGEDYPTPGVSILLNTRHEDCADKQNICDIVMLSANPDMHGNDGDGGNGGGGGGGGGNDGGNNGGGGGSSNPHITATVSGTQQAGTSGVQGSWILNGSGGNNLTAQTGGTPPNVWTIQHLRAAVGTYACGTANVGNVTFMNSAGLAGDPLNAWRYMNLTSAHTSNGGQCSVTVTKADDTVMEGTFTATIVGLGPVPGQVVTYNVTGGSFSVPKQ